MNRKGFETAFPSMKNRPVDSFDQEVIVRETTREENIQRLNQLFKNFQVAMLTTIQPRDGSLHSRPMMVQPANEDGSLWFFSKFSTAKIDEIRAGSQVNLAYADPSQGRYISISGAAYILRDRIQMEALWSEVYRQWFPEGIDEPDLVLLRVNMTSAEIWDRSSQADGAFLKLS